MTLFRSNFNFFARRLGSCNDVLEVKIRANEPSIKLQRGPKSYSYGPFVRALELCRDIVNGKSSTYITEPSGVNHNDCESAMIDDGDLEAFLDPCVNASDDDNDFIDDGDSEEDARAEGEDFGDCLYNTPVNSNAGQTGRSARTSMLNDIHALDTLKEILQNVKTRLLANSLAKQFHGERGRDNETDNDDNNNKRIDINHFTVEDQYCLILIRSEIETVDFYLAAIRELHRRLVERLSELEGPTVIDKVVKNDRSVGDKSLCDQITSVATTFLSIRYP